MKRENPIAGAYGELNNHLKILNKKIEDLRDEAFSDLFANLEYATIVFLEQLYKIPKQAKETLKSEDAKNYMRNSPHVIKTFEYFNNSLSLLEKIALENNKINLRWIDDILGIWYNLYIAIRYLRIEDYNGLTGLILSIMDKMSIKIRNYDEKQQEFYKKHSEIAFGWGKDYFNKKVVNTVEIILDILDKEPMDIEKLKTNLGTLFKHLHNNLSNITGQNRKIVKN